MGGNTQPPEKDDFGSAVAEVADGNSDSSFEMVGGDSDECSTTKPRSGEARRRPQSILLNGSPPREEPTGLVSVLTHKFSTSVASKFRRNTAYQCGAKFMSNAPPRRDTMSSEPGAKRRTSIHFAPLPEGKPRGSQSFTLGVEARRDILRGLIPLPDSRNPNTITLSNPSEAAVNNDDNESSKTPANVQDSNIESAPQANTYSCKDIVPACRKIAAKLQKGSSIEKGSKSTQAQDDSSNENTIWLQESAIAEDNDEDEEAGNECEKKQLSDDADKPNPNLERPENGEVQKQIAAKNHDTNSD